ncbi:putative metal-dependent phosphoesterase TrpH [Caldalkalibacillus uzonensis]|uniref:Metal-dependent phosphoesterase TrpH n=1 Tax=Caldalkalibacillus uzonensis TaxID=353224 RepID=A0ABU0CRF9_9BACI|nr:PHP domain-containing protein [Caldalkalibacillus uzonensis]MDQ0339009.1 putative metal-dependent phosphoesterase TrpH [Caldalkalibacillus uzonensis]
MDLDNIIKQGHFDLHIHSTASDGVYTPEELVKKAAKSGLKTISITDHDTLAGIEEAKKAGKRYGVRVIPGVELSTKYKGKSIDILGYNVSTCGELTETLTKLREGRYERALRIIAQFNELGMPLTLDDVKKFSQDGVIGRPHIARAVVHKGYVSDYQEVFDHYLADGKPCAVNKVTLSPQQGIDLIHRAGGKAVLAHPVFIGNDELVRELLHLFNFDGIEVWHREHRTEDQRRYQNMAHEFKLVMTGGSDFHHDQHHLGQFR